MWPVDSGRNRRLRRCPTDSRGVGIAFQGIWPVFIFIFFSFGMQFACYKYSGLLVKCQFVFCNNIIQERCSFNREREENVRIDQNNLACQSSPICVSHRVKSIIKIHEGYFLTIVCIIIISQEFWGINIHTPSSPWLSTKLKLYESKSCRSKYFDCPQSCQ